MTTPGRRLTGGGLAAERLRSRRESPAELALPRLGLRFARSPPLGTIRLLGSSSIRLLRSATLCLDPSPFPDDLFFSRNCSLLRFVGVSLEQQPATTRSFDQLAPVF